MRVTRKHRRTLESLEASVKLEAKTVAKKKTVTLALNITLRTLTSPVQRFKQSVTGTEGQQTRKTWFWDCRNMNAYSF